MKRVVSVSLGSSTRDARAEAVLLGTRVELERVGTDGDWGLAAAKLRDLDGRVDAIGLGGADFGIELGARSYPLPRMKALRNCVRATPLVDGSRFRAVAEGRVARIVDRLSEHHGYPKRVLLVCGVSRWDMTLGFAEAGYQLRFGDLLFSLGLPLSVRRVETARWLAALLMPVVGRLPPGAIYPVGKQQEKNTPRCGRWFRWASVVAGDCLFIKRYMPDCLSGLAVVTNTTTREDRREFQRRGARLLITTTPRLNGRSFGTNLVEAALVAVSGERRPLPAAQIERLALKAGIEPQIDLLNEADA